MKKKSSFLFIVLTCFTLILAACSGGDSASSSEDTGEYNADKKPVEIIAPADPGSGWDTTARALAQALEKEDLVHFPVQVINEPGATGAVSLSKLINSHKGDDLRISVTSTAMLANHYYGNSEYSYWDVTMIARLLTEYYIVVVPADSPYETIEDLINAIKEDPQSVSVGSAGDDRLPFALAVHEAGGDATQIKFIDYPGGGGDIANAMLSGDLDAAISGVSEFIGQIESGNFRGLAVTSEERLSGSVSEVPTLIEQGIDVEYGNWRAVMGPPEMPETAVKYWEETLKKVLETDTFKEIAENNQWEITYMVGDELKEYIDESDELIKIGLELTGQID